MCVCVCVCVCVREREGENSEAFTSYFFSSFFLTLIEWEIC